MTNETTARVSCSQCQLARINGVLCHETDCPRSWINPATDEAYPVECFECGGSFEPETRPHRRMVCGDCINDEL